MKTIVVSKEIAAPVANVFQTISDIRNFSEVLPHITGYEFLSETKHGIGTRFVETRMMKNNEHKTELEVTEFEENSHVRMVADSNDTIWDTTFKTSETDGVTTLTLSMDAYSHRWACRIVNFLFRGMIAKSVNTDMQIVKRHLENQA
ncbi:MAG: hypothetical protein ACI97A_000079 [Planctomycetota bacterium]|jgi:hypothetical protein